MSPLSTIEAALLALAQARPELGLEPEPRQATVPLTASVASAELDFWLRTTASIAEGVDAKTAAAYLISIFVWRFDDILASLYLDGAALPHLTADVIRVGLFLGTHGRSRDIQFRFHIAAIDGGRPHDRDGFVRSLIDIHQPLVLALHERTGLSKGALWRLVSDGISGGFLAHGQRSGSVEAAMETARQVLAAAPFHNSQWTFHRAEAGTGSAWFRLRGGCCRLYLTEGGDYCTTCVLRRREDQMARLQRFVAEGGA